MKYSEEYLQQKESKGKFFEFIKKVDQLDKGINEETPKASYDINELDINFEKGAKT